MKVSFDEIVSTSTYIKEHISMFSHGDCVTASFQTAGRGQRGNSWESERGANALLSIYLQPYALSPSDGFVLNHIVALAILDVLNNTMPQHRFMVKWPNDIYVNDLKLCGILIESAMSGKCIESAVVGIGLNVNQERFLSDAPNPVSMFQLTGKKYNVGDIIDAITLSVTKRYERNINGENFYDEYMSNLYRRGEWHEYIDSDGLRFTGMIMGVRPDGLLAIKTKDDSKLRCFEFKTIKYII
ncbi:MAG: biotin--[acetyl-CoA-carboxylase] ligase [Paludibacteraceae bacterium]|nr:biotin--[acetyl-CoA-carboxylase] ligase [Paludibacteraceae bacterium]